MQRSSVNIFPGEGWEGGGGVPPQMNNFFSSENLKEYRAIKINISYLTDTDLGANIAIIRHQSSQIISMWSK